MKQQKTYKNLFWIGVLCGAITGAIVALVFGPTPISSQPMSPSSVTNTGADSTVRTVERDNFKHNKSNDMTRIILDKGKSMSTMSDDVT